MKQVHWQLPFASLDGTQYRIDIYAEGTPVGGIRQLAGGATPFTTDEDNSDDFFEPVRSQTGMIHIVNTSGLVTLDELIPSDNVDKPVQLIRVSDGAVMWQGFLSCEVYSQEYTARPHSIDLNVNSVLEAMKSVEITYSLEEGAKMMSFGELVALAGYENVVMPTPLVKNMSERGAFKYNWVEPSEEETIERTYRRYKGKSIYEVLSSVCKTLCLVAREFGDILVLQERNEGNNFDYTLLGTSTKYAISKNPMSALAPHGKNNQISIANGAKAVSISSKGKSAKGSMELVKCPPMFYDSDEVVKVGSTFHTGSVTWYILCDINNEVFKHMPDFTFIPRWVYVDRGDKTLNIRYLGENATNDDVKNVVYQGQNSHMQQFDPSEASNTRLAVGATTVNFSMYDGNKSYAENAYGMLMTCINKKYARDNTRTYGTTNTDVIPSCVTCRFPMPTHDIVGNRGMIKIDSEAFFICKNGPLNERLHVVDTPGIKVRMMYDGQYLVSERVGEKCRYSWSVTPGDAELLFDENGKVKKAYDEDNTNLYESTDSLVIPGPKVMSGAYIDTYPEEKHITMSIYPVITGSRTDKLGYVGYEARYVLLKKLDISPISTKDFVEPETSRTFRRLLGNKFSEEKSIDMDICSWYTGTWSELNRIWADAEDPEEKHYKAVNHIIGYYADERPEMFMLANMAKYYAVPRRVIELEVERPVGVLPLVRLTGYDGKTYLPLSESREWKTGVSTIRCFEVPDPS